MNVRLLIALVIAQFFIKFGNGLAIQALSPFHWYSNATIYYRSSGRNNRTTSFLCKFENVYADTARIYFLPKSQEAIHDLLSCCFPQEIQHDAINHCDKSVDIAVCDCFRSKQKFVPAVWISEVKKLITSAEVIDYGNRTAWLMNHWCLRKHIDHFNMKMLEMLGYLGGKAFLKAQNTSLGIYEYLPDHIEVAVSMDYEVHPLSLYEQMILGIVKNGLGSNFMLHTLNNNNWIKEESFHLGKVTPRAYLSTFCVSLKSALGNQTLHHLRAACATLQQHHKSITTSEERLTNDNFGFVASKLAYFPQSVYLSPDYKNNIPEPSVMTREVIHRAFVEYTKDVEMPSLHRDYPCPPPTLKKDSNDIPRVVIIQRSEGMGMRQFINLDDMLRTVQRVLNVDAVQMFYINSRTPPLMQAMMFCSAHVIISPHSSQLSNLVFSRPGIFVIEVRPAGYSEFSFEQISKKMGHRYYLFDKPNLAATVNGTIIPHGSDTPNNVWAAWNTIVDIRGLETILKDVASKLYEM
jgi:hypothetical protein